MNAIDRVLDSLAAAPSADASYEPYGTNDPSKCWRCLGPAGDGSSGVCAECRVILLGDGPIEPAAPPIVAWMSERFTRIDGHLDVGMLVVAPTFVARATDAIRQAAEAHRQLVARITADVRPAMEAFARLLESIDAMPLVRAKPPWKAAHARRYGR